MKRANHSDWIYFRRLLITVAVVGIAYVVWKTAGIFLLMFAAILFALLLAGLADVTSQVTSINRRWTLPIVTVVLILVLGGLSFTFGPQAVTQIGEVFNRVPEVLDSVGRQFDVSNLSEHVTAALTADGGGQFFLKATTIGYTLVGMVTNLALVMVAGLYLAADPRSYRVGAAMLFPPDQHERVLDAMKTTARALRLWFLGQLISMVLVGTLSALVFWFIGLPMPIGLGLIAGITNFIPLVGPILGAIPALLFAFTLDVNVIVWTVVAIIVIQHLEGYVLMPLVQRLALDIPPVVLLFGIAIFGVLFGWLGIILAAPLTVTLMVLVQKLWVRETLGEKVKVPGEAKST